ncbi:MAG: DUF11 domain-containing protein, partial [Flavobacteriaceae bacterium]|nr:DUF11 domain-containing protein [Flavobacteriaceae bacterium]
MRNQLSSNHRITSLQGKQLNQTGFSDRFSTPITFLISTLFFFLLSFTLFAQDQTFTVTYSSGVGFMIDNQQQPTLTLEKAKTYRFDLSDSSLLIYDFAFSTTSDGTFGGGTIFTDGVTYVGTPANSGAYVDITVPISTTSLYYFDESYSNRGGTITLTEPKYIEVTSYANVIDNDDGTVGGGTVSNGDKIEYRVNVTNLSDAPISSLSLSSFFQGADNSSLSLTEALTFSSSNAGSSEGTLSVGETATYVASYTFETAGVSAGGVEFYAIATGSTPGETDNATDTSDDGRDYDGNTSDDPNQTNVGDSITSIEVEKTADYSGTQPVVGEVWSYTITVTNTGSADLTNIVVNDVVTDNNGRTLAFVSPATPPYIIYISSDQGSTEGDLVSGETSTYTATVIFDQAAADAGGIQNCIDVAAANTNDQTDTATDDYPCVETDYVESPSIEVTKTATISDNGDGINGTGDVITYEIFIENTGDVTLTGVSLTEDFEDFSANNLSTSLSGPTFDSSSLGSSAGTLQVGEKARYLATYTVGLLAANSGGVTNQVTASGLSPENVTVTDLSDDGDDTDGNTLNDRTETTLVAQKSLLVTKTVIAVDVNNNGEIGSNDRLDYEIKVENDGEVQLSNLSVVDNLNDSSGNLVTTLSTTFESSTGSFSPGGALQVGEIATYSASRVITNSDVSLGSLHNRAIATASSPGKTNDVTDKSDNPNTALVNDATITSFTPSPEFEITKVATLIDVDNSGSPSVDDEIDYVITVENTGNVGISSITIVDVFERATSSQGANAFGLTEPAIEFDSSAQGNSYTAGFDPTTTAFDLFVGDVLTFLSSYTITADDISSGFLINQIDGSGTYGGNTITDTSDNGDDTDLNDVDDPTVVEISQNPEVNIIKSVTTSTGGPVGVGDTLTFTMLVENTGNVDLTNLTVQDDLTGYANPSSFSLTTGPTFLGTDGLNNTDSTRLNVGETATYEATFEVNQTAVNDVGVSNKFYLLQNGVAVQDKNNLASGSVDDGNDDDPTKTSTDIVIATNASIKVVKTSDFSDSNTNGVLDAGETLVYTIAVKNTGNVFLDNVNFVDDLLDAGSETVSFLDELSTIVYYYDLESDGVTQVNSPSQIAPGNTAYYRASILITQEIVNYGGLKNRVTVTADDPRNNEVTDTSDDGDVFDGNNDDDYTEDVIPQNGLIEVTKTVAIDFNNIEEVVVTVAGGKYYLNGILQDQITLEKTKTYRFDQSDTSNAGHPISFGTAADGTGTSLSSTSVGTPGTAGAYTEIIIDSSYTSVFYFCSNHASMGAEASVISYLLNAQKDDVLNYTITIENKGNVDLNSITVNDILQTLDNNGITLNSPGLVFAGNSDNSGSATQLKSGETITYTASYTVNQTAVDDGGVKNSFVVNAQTFIGDPVSDTSDDGIDDDGNNIDDPTVVSVIRTPSIEVEKTYTWADTNTNGKIDLDEVITFTISITNTGNVTVDQFEFIETFSNINGNRNLALDQAPSTTQSPTQILPGETIVYTAPYTVTQQSIDDGGLSNSALVKAVGSGEIVEDISDDPTDNTTTTQDPTVIVITPQPKIEATLIVDYFEDNDSDGLYSDGDIVVYRLAIENTGNVSQQNVVKTSTITNFTTANLTLETFQFGQDYTFEIDGQQYTSTAYGDKILWLHSTKGSSSNYIKSGEIAYYFVRYLVKSADVTSGGISHSIEVNTNDSTSTNIQSTDISDDGDDTDNNTTDDPTIIYTGNLPEIEVVKTGVLNDSDSVAGSSVGDQVVFTITVSNTGSGTINDLSYVDTMTNGYGLPITPVPALQFESTTDNSTTTGVLSEGETETYSLTYNITQNDIDSGGVINSIRFSGNSSRNQDTSFKDVHDVSDNGDDTDGNTTDDPTTVLLGLDTDGDGIPNTTDLDDDNDGILDRDEGCAEFILNGSSFEQYIGSNSSPANELTAFPDISKAPPFSAVNGDGEIWQAGSNTGTYFAPKEGNKYIELLQNDNGYNDLEWWNEESYTAAINESGSFTYSYDRIVVIQDVNPDTNYSIDFWHKEGGRLNVTHAGGGQTLLQVQSMQTEDQSFQKFDPTVNTNTDANGWSPESYQFTTDSSTTQVAILFSAYAPNLNVSIQLDAIDMNLDDDCDPDIDDDGIPNQLDLDSDNDGIYDLVEAGLENYDTNGDGMLDANDTGYQDTNGDLVNDATYNHTPLDTDGDGIMDAFEIDSDGDLCNDVVEAGFSDPDGDGELGDDLPYTYASNGTVSSATDGYTTPQDMDNDSTMDYRQSTYDIACLNPEILITKTAAYTQSDNNGTYDAGDIITYTIQVTNNSTNEATVNIKSIKDIQTNGQEDKELDLEFVTRTSQIPFTPENLIDDSFWSYSNGSNGGWNGHWTGGREPPPPGILVYFDQNNAGYISQSDMNNAGFDWGLNIYDDYSNGDNWYTDNGDLIPDDFQPYYVRHDSYDFFQNVTLKPNTTYTFSFYHKHY